MRAWRRATTLTSEKRITPSRARNYWKTTEAVKKLGSITEEYVPRAKGRLQGLQQESLKSDDLLGELEVEGYVRSIRKQKRIAFAAIADGSNLQSVQAVLEPAQAEL